MMRPLIGSPPQVRGKELQKILGERIRRITPAGAGKSTNNGFGSTLFKDHPRRCGEKFSIGLQYHKRTGSPPQVRGKVLISSGMKLPDRITPAGAGKRSIFFYHCRDFRDHPRRCGEKCRLHRQIAQKAGSPPQVRGKVYFPTLTFQKIRITPAGAGKSAAPPCEGRARWDHPRRCGEKSLP